MNNFVLIDEYHEYPIKSIEVLEKFYQDFRIKIDINKEAKLINIYTLSKNNPKIQQKIFNDMFKNMINKGYKLNIEYNPQKFNKIIIIEQKL